MAKFCKKCGAGLDALNGLCPNCDKIEIVSMTEEPEEISSGKPEPEKQLSKKEQKKEKKKLKKQAKKDKKKQKRAQLSTKQKVKRFFIKFFAVILALAIAVSGCACALVYFDLADIPFVDNILVSIGIKDGEQDVEDVTDVSPESVKVTAPDADSYFESNSSVVSEIKANESGSVLAESEVYTDLTGRGFTEFPITTEYSMEGEYSKASEISDFSSTKHPMYETDYIAENGDVWTIYVINGSVMASPVSYNLQSSSGVQLIISESEVITSYDSTTNKFYETIPNQSALIIKTVSKIDAETLESLTFGEIDAL